jgi:hypothetical protein
MKGQGTTTTHDQILLTIYLIYKLHWNTATMHIHLLSVYYAKMTELNT